MNIFLQIGNWLDKRFPEKITSAQVAERFDNFQKNFATKQELMSIIDDIHSVKMLHEDVKKLKEELNVFKTQSVIKSRMTQTTISPYASRLTNPNGGNASPQ